MSELQRLLIAHIEASGPITFDEYQAQCLYSPELGFYSTGHGAGRRRDFLTSPEVGPLFGAVLARALDAWWREAGEPDRVHVVEVGAGPGTLAKSILKAEPQCSDALSMTLVETSEPQRQSHPESVRSLGRMPKFVELNADMVVVLANELLDNMPVALVERRPEGWCEVLVGVENGVLVELFEPLGAEQATWCELRAPSAPEGTRMPVQSESVAWLGGALELIRSARGGRVVVIDYARPASIDFAELLQSEWLRTYAQHGRSDNPYETPGELDITCDVAIDQLATAGLPDVVRSQAEFLMAHGIDELVAQGRAKWDELGLGGGLEAIAARSRVPESEALLDPAGLGGFTVIEWTS